MHWDANAVFGSSRIAYQHAHTTSEQGELQNKALPSTQKSGNARAERRKPCQPTFLGTRGIPHEAKHKRGEQSSSLHEAFPKDVQEFEVH